MRVTRWLVPVVAAVVLASCSDQSPPAPTEAPRFDHIVGTQCDAALATQVYSQIDVVFSGQQRTRARQRFDAVVATCSTQSTALANLMTFIKYTIQQKGQINTSAGATLLERYQALALLWDMGFVFVGFESPTDATGVNVALSLTDAGAAGVFNSGILVTGTAFAGLNALSGYPNGERLWLIVPITCPTGSGLTGLCFDFSVHPADLVNDQFVHSGLCPLNDPGSEHGRRELAYAFNDALKFKIPQKTSTPGFALDCDAAPTALLDEGEAWWQYATVEPSLMTRLAGALGRIVGPRTAYAIHGGLHSTSTTRDGSFTGNPWGVADPLLLDDDYENDDVGQPPFRPNVGELDGSGLPAPWTIDVTSPASVLVKQGFADNATKVAVIEQKGGASAGSPPLTFYARVLGIAPFRGRVAARWQSAISSSTMRSPAPIIVRSFDGTEIVGTVEYRPGKSAKSGPIFFDGTQVGTWRQGISQYFELLVDLDTDATQLFIGTSGWPGSLAGSSTTTASNVGRWGVELAGQDAQLFGVDNVSINLRPLVLNIP